MNVVLSKNWLPSRAMKRKPSTIVLHATAGNSALSSILWLRHIGLSYHYIIERDGTIHKLVPTTNQAFHAGKSVGPEGANVNGYSIGIAFANRNDGEEYTEEQTEACRELIEDLKKAFPSLKWLTTHRLISPGRKTDPKGFPLNWFHFRLTSKKRIRLWKPSDDIQFDG